MVKPLISVIVPVYKVEQYLKKCVDSIIMQSYHNLEIILVDDGSPDKCGDICDEYKKLDSRIKVVHKKNGGLSSARNAGLDVATGEYIGFVDSDDFIDKYMYERLLRAFDYDKQAGITSCMIKKVRNGEKSDYKVAWKIDETRIISSDHILLDLLTTKRNYTVWSKLYKRNLIGNIRFEEGKINEDVLFIFALYEIVKAQKVNLVEIPYYGYYYLMRSDSICNTTDKFLEFSIVENYHDMGSRIEAKDHLLARELHRYADLVLLNFYCKAYRLNRNDLKDKLQPKVKKLKLSNINMASQKFKLLIIKYCPYLFNLVLKKI